MSELSVKWYRWKYKHDDAWFVIKFGSCFGLFILTICVFAVINEINYESTEYKKISDYSCKKLELYILSHGHVHNFMWQVYDEKGCEFS